ncbi:amidohydrolase [Streptomyces sp. NPDC057621]|uniref:amidohydrolase n=1 Tax=Streptomyces sp. NPDC057621 TaxID=3346186 RepID=UPI00367B5541
MSALRQRDTAGRDHAGEPVRLLTGPRILDGAGGEPEALAVRSGWIVTTGTRQELRDAHPGAEEVALDGALMVPGFNDAHCHPSQAALARVRADLDTVVGPEALAAALREQAERTPPDAWVVGQPWDERRHGHIDREFLDLVSRDRPVLAVHYSLHRAVVNSAGLAGLGYYSPRDAPHGGQLGATADGRLDGHLVERAWLDPWLPGTGQPSIVPSAAPEDQLAALAEVIAELHACGITSFCDALVTPVEQQMYAALEAEGRLTARVGMLRWHTYANSAPPPGDAPDPLRLRTVGVKMMLDGALSGGTCRCRSPYPSATGTDNGLNILSPEEFARTVQALHAEGIRVAVHANGDDAIATVLDVFESLPDNSIRNRIEHCSIVDDDLVARLASSRTIAVPFGSFVTLHGEKLTEYYGERTAMMCAHRSLREAGIVVAGSSDYPLAPADPVLALHSLTTRTTARGTIVGAEQRVSVREALDIYTRGSAAAADEEGIKGTLTPGRLADLTVLDTDLTTADPETRAAARVRSTWVGGECVHHS